MRTQMAESLYFARLIAILEQALCSSVTLVIYRHSIWERQNSLSSIIC
jgi:hypothetical protein